MEEKHGIKETKEALIFGVSLAMAVDEATQDGFQWTDIFKMVPALTKLPAAIEGIEKVPVELSDLSEAERAELVEEIEKLDFVSEYSEQIAEQALRVAVEIGALIGVIREAKRFKEENQ